MRRYVFAGVALISFCLGSVFVWEKLIRAPIYKIYYRLFDYSQPIGYELGYDPTYSDYPILSGPIDKITQSQSTDARRAAEPFLEELSHKSDYELIILKTADEVCTTDIISCGVISSSVAKQYIEAIYSRRQFLEARADQRFYNKIALAGAITAISSLLFSLMLGILQLRVKRKT